MLRKYLCIFGIVIFPSQLLSQTASDLERQAISTFTNISVGQAYCNLSSEQNEMAENVKAALENIYKTTPLRNVPLFSNSSSMFERASNEQKSQMCTGITGMIETLSSAL